ncbi:MAG: hypothetical protein CVV49_08850 [Spirochaetae bacterium HGW-Spirochaetae-5]|nr:MAG: hypothetical protein CVV49_08850 [Spirochaetae bacterium HGW-Spirochaetae-5]
MFLNETNALIQILKLLDDPTVYKYEDTYKEETVTTGEPPDEVTTTVQVIDKTASELMQVDLITISEEVYLAEMLKIVPSAEYAVIQGISFESYTANQKRLFYAECYFVASKFLIAWSLRNETEMYKSTLDFSSRTIGVEKSGKLYTAEEYSRTALANVAEYERVYFSSDMDTYYGRNKRSSISIGRY